MKLEQQFPNYLSALNFVIGDKNPVMVSNDSKKISHFLGLANFEKGFDYYELDRHPNGNITFSLVTVLGLNTIVTTSVPINKKDLEHYEWTDLIINSSMFHFRKEEYLALKKGYVKKNSNVGCMVLLALLAAIISPIIIYRIF